MDWIEILQNEARETALQKKETLRAERIAAKKQAAAEAAEEGGEAEDGDPAVGEGEEEDGDLSLEPWEDLPASFSDRVLHVGHLAKTKRRR